jgi:hypothetical protein
MLILLESPDVCKESGALEPVSARQELFGKRAASARWAGRDCSCACEEQSVSQSLHFGTTRFKLLGPMKSAG